MRISFELSADIFIVPVVGHCKRARPELVLNCSLLYTNLRGSSNSLSSKHVSLIKQ